LEKAQCIQKYQRIEKYHKSKLKIERDLQKEIAANCDKAKVKLKNLWREKFNAQGKLCEQREVQFKKQLDLALKDHADHSAMKGKLAGCEEDSLLARQKTQAVKKELEDVKEELGKVKAYAKKRIRQLKNIHKSCDRKGAMELVRENERIKRKYSRYKEKRLSWKKERHMYKAVIKDLKKELEKMMKTQYEYAKTLEKDEAKDDKQLYGENLDDETKDIDKSKLRYSRKSATLELFKKEMKEKRAEEKKKNGDMTDKEGAEDEDELELTLDYKLLTTTTTTETPNKDADSVKKIARTKDVTADDAGKGGSKGDDVQEKVSAPNDYRGEDHVSDTRARKQKELEENKKAEADRMKVNFDDDKQEPVKEKKVEVKRVQPNYDDDRRPTAGRPDDAARKGRTQVAVASAEDPEEDELIKRAEDELNESKTPSSESFESEFEQGDSEEESPLNSNLEEDDDDYGTIGSEKSEHDRLIDFGPESQPQSDDLDVNDENLDNTEPNEVLHPERFQANEALRRLLRR